MDKSRSSKNVWKAADIENAIMKGNSDGLAIANITYPDPNSEIKWKNPLTVLVVDNSETRRKVNAKLLVSLGVECWEAESGAKAVEIIECGVVFNLIIMEKDMPILDGPSTTKMIRGMKVRCVILGVAPDILYESEKYQFMMSGLDEYEDKPLTRKRLIPLLRDIDDDHRLNPSWKMNQ